MAVGVVFGIIMFIVVLCILAFTIPAIVGQWKVFEKAGQPGWCAVIPYYNTWKLYEISGVKPVFSLFLVGGMFCNIIGNSLSIAAQSGDSYIAAFGLVSILFSFISIGLNITSIVFSIKAALNLAVYCGKEQVYGLGLAFLPFIFYPMLGFDKNVTYNKPVESK